MDVKGSTRVLVVDDFAHHHPVRASVELRGRAGGSTAMGDSRASFEFDAEESVS
jgi:hypothetical protein